MADNTSVETVTGPLTVDAAAARLVGSLADSDATPQDPDSEQEHEAEIEAQAEIEDEAPEDIEAADEVDGDDAGDDADDDVEYEASEESDDDDEEPVFEIEGEEVTLDEIGKRYLRQADYTKKTQELAAERKTLADERASIAAERQHLQQVLASVQSAQPEGEVDWIQLATDDPLEYTRQRAIYEANQAEREALTAEQRRLQHVQAQEQQKALQSFVQEQSALMVEKIPELAGENGVQYKAELQTYMEGSGYSKEELAQLFDHRAVVAFDKARKYDELMSQGSKAKKKVKGKPRVIKPGAQKGKRASATVNRNKQKARLRKSGSQDDAVALLMG